MAIVAIWDFGAAGLKLGDPDMPAPALGAPAADTDAPGADDLTLDTGTLRVGFRQLVQIGPDEDRILTFDAGGTRLTLGVTEDGVVRLTHVTADDVATFETPEEFFAPGDSVLVTHGWDFGGTEGRLIVENLSTEARFEAPVPGTMTLDESALDPDAWIPGDPDEPHVWGFNGRLTHLSLHDDPVTSDDDADAEVDVALAAVPLADGDRDAAPGPEAEQVSFTYEGGTAGTLDSFGVYVLDPATGEVGGVHLVWPAVKADMSGGDLVPGESVFALPVPPGAQVGAFLIAEGGALNDLDALGPGRFAFRDEAGTPATPDDPEAMLVHLAEDGTVTPVFGDIWHSAEAFPQPGPDPDSIMQLLGIAANEDGSLTFGWEGRPADDPDAEPDMLLFTVDLGRSGARFLNPDFDAVAPMPPADAASPHILAGDDDAPHVPASAKDDEQGDEVLVLRATDRVAEADHAATTGAPGAAEVHEAEMQLAEVVKIVPCFTPGTLIDTSRGPVPVERLVVGDRVLTRDHGFQPLRWVGRKDVDVYEMDAKPEFRPVLIDADALGPGLPARAMRVSPQHRILMCGPEAEMLFGNHEVLVPALHLVGQPGILREAAPTVTYIHVMCDRHEILRGDGVWSESFQPGDMSLAGLDLEQRAELFALFPELAAAEGRRDYRAARMTLKAHEARALLAPVRPRRPNPAAVHARFGSSPDGLAAERWDRLG